KIIRHASMQSPQRMHSASPYTALLSGSPAPTLATALDAAALAAGIAAFAAAPAPNAFTVACAATPAPALVAACRPAPPTTSPSARGSRSTGQILTHAPHSMHGEGSLRNTIPIGVRDVTKR